MRRIQNFGVLYFVLVAVLIFLFGSGSEAGSINKDPVEKCKISRFEVLKKISGSSQVEKFIIPDFEINEDQIRRDISQLKQTSEIGYSKFTADINVSALNDLDDLKNISKQSDNSLTLNQDLNLSSQDLQAVIISKKINITTISTISTPTICGRCSSRSTREWITCSSSTRLNTDTTSSATT